MLRKLFRSRRASIRPAPGSLIEAQAAHGRLRAAVYWHRGERFFLSAAQGCSEYLEPVLLPGNVDDATLGQALVDRLLAYDPSDVARPDHTGRDWRVLQASKACSARQFNADTDWIHVETIDTAVVLHACPRAPSTSRMTVDRQLGLLDMPAEFGGAIRSLLHAVQVLRKAGCW